MAFQEIKDGHEQDNKGVESTATVGKPTEGRSMDMYEKSETSMNNGKS